MNMYMFRGVPLVRSWLHINEQYGMKSDILYICLDISILIRKKNVVQIV
jgi:hypothetical protein